MPEFLELLPPTEALNLLLKHISPHPRSEVVETVQALNRVTSNPVIAPHPLPSFPRATVDGYAVRAMDTFGANDTLPAYLNVIGEVPMGAAAPFALAAGQSAVIHTGGMLPEGADAVVMIEHTQSAAPGEVEILRAVAVGENVLKVGEDVAEGEVVLPAGIRLRPAEIGGLMALGMVNVPVSAKPRVGILSSGDEIIPPEAPLAPGQVRDVNAYTLSALVESVGGEPKRYGIIPDQIDLLRRAARLALTECELVVITAGSSASSRDLTAQVINELGSPGVIVHGVNVKPGKPTILAACDGKAVIGLPGNPVSALVIAWLFVVPVLERALGLRSQRFRPFVSARLTINLASQAGREDWVPVRLISGVDGWQAEPIFSKSNLIFSLSRADGLVRIHADANGVAAGEVVEVFIL